MSKQPPPAPATSAIGPCPTIIQISRTPRDWKFTQHLRTTQPPQMEKRNYTNFPKLNKGPLVVLYQQKDSEKVEKQSTRWRKCLTDNVFE